MNYYLVNIFIPSRFAMAKAAFLIYPCTLYPSYPMLFLFCELTDGTYLENDSISRIASSNY